MNDDQFKGQWKQFKGRVRDQWGKLTDDDVEQVQGNKQRLVGLLQERYGDAKEAAVEKVNHFIDNINEKLS